MQHFATGGSSDQPTSSVNPLRHNRRAAVTRQGNKKPLAAHDDERLKQGCCTLRVTQFSPKAGSRGVLAKALQPTAYDTNVACIGCTTSCLRSTVLIATCTGRTSPPASAARMNAQLPIIHSAKTTVRPASGLRGNNTSLFGWILGAANRPIRPATAERVTDQDTLPTDRARLTTSPRRRSGPHASAPEVRRLGSTRRGMA